MFSHAFDFAFSVNSELADASDVSPAVLRAALVRRVGAKTFDRLIMVLLVVIAVMLIWESV